jgi:hypothetical protein
MSSPVHHAKDLDPALTYAPPWARERALSTRSSVPYVGRPPRFPTYEISQFDFAASHIADNPAADNPAYDAAIECAALCMIAIKSAGNDSFRRHLREALREALYLRGGFHESKPLVHDNEVRNVLSDVVTRTISLSQLCETAPQFRSQPEAQQIFLPA